jgi:DNA-binding transcriptional regulator YdaS (Cro superfamily)
LNNKHQHFVQKAIKILGSQTALAKALGISQQGISYLLRHTSKPTAEMAKRIEKVTKGKVTRSQLRPDLYGGYKRKPKKSDGDSTSNASQSSVAAGEVNP